MCESPSVCVCVSVYLMDALEYFALLLSGRAAAAQAVSSEQNYNWNWISIFNALLRAWVNVRDALEWLPACATAKLIRQQQQPTKTIGKSFNSQINSSSTRAQHQLSHIDRSVRGLPPLHILLHFNDTSTIECANLFAVFSYFSIYTCIYTIYIDSIT